MKKTSALVSAISNITGDKAIYKLMPTCAHEIGDITVSKEGCAEACGKRRAD